MAKLLNGYAAIKPAEAQKQTSIIITNDEAPKCVGVLVEDLTLGDVALKAGAKVIFNNMMIITTLEGVHYLKSDAIMAVL